jgi:hypothetical protein
VNAPQKRKYRHSMWVWNAREGSDFYDPSYKPGIKIIPHPGKGADEGYGYSDGACYPTTKKWSSRAIQIKMLVGVIDLMDLYKLRYEEIHKAFMEIEEYADIDHNMYPRNADDIR